MKGCRVGFFTRGYIHHKLFLNEFPLDQRGPMAILLQAQLEHNLLERINSGVIDTFHVSHAPSGAFNGRHPMHAKQDMAQHWGVRCFYDIYEYSLRSLNTGNCHIFVALWMRMAVCWIPGDCGFRTRYVAVVNWTNLPERDSIKSTFEHALQNGVLMFQYFLSETNTKLKSTLGYTRDIEIIHVEDIDGTPKNHFDAEQFSPKRYGWWKDPNNTPVLHRVQDQ